MNPIRSLRDLEQWCADKPAAWVVKADGSWGGHGVKIARTFSEAAAAFKALSEPLSTTAMLKRMLVNRDAFWVEVWREHARPNVSVQEFIEGRPANCVAFCVDGRILALIAVEVVSAQSATGPATVVQVVENAQMSDAAQKLAARLKLSGFYGFDFMIRDLDQQVFLIEMNPRTALPCHLRLDDGRDLIGALARHVGSQTAPDSKLFSKSRAFAYFPQAWYSGVPGDLLRNVHHDVPWDEPDLVKELVRIPWPDRSILARLSDRLRKTTFQQRSQEGAVFPAAAAKLKRPASDESVRSLSTYLLKS
jgi:hypothetical protein